MFLCLLNTDGSRVSDVVRMRYASRIRELAQSTAVASDHVECVDAGEFVAFVAPALVPMRPLWSQRRGLVGIGNVRLDHRNTVRQWSHNADADAPDIAMVLSAVDARGTGCLHDTLGDFAVVIWEARTRTLTAARDAFGVKTLFVGQREQLFILSSHLELVHESETLDEEYVADFLLGGDPGPERTIWADSRALAPGSALTVQQGRRSSERFWNPRDFEPHAGGDARALIEQFRTLFQQAVLSHLAPGERVWAELSGGLDSSSIVSTLQTLVETGVVSHGVAGTISVVDELGAGNERCFSDLVVQRFNLPNTTILNPWPWQADGHSPPRTDEPRTHYPFFARDRSICDTVRTAGAHVLLSGTGSDHYLYGNKLYIADLVARGHLGNGCFEAVRWAIIEKRSFWSTLTRDIVLPLSPVAVQRRFLSPWLQVPDWIVPAFARRLDMAARLPVLSPSRASAGQMFSRQVADQMQELCRWLPRGSFEEGIELRYPFLYRPLVEFGLQLSPDMRAKPLAPKWILRQAMKDILPEPIRTRSGKGAIDARLIWGFRHERKQISEILSRSHLAELGIVDIRQFVETLNRAGKGEVASIVMLLAALSLETWLQVRSQRPTMRSIVSQTGMDVNLAGKLTPEPLTA